MVEKRWDSTAMNCFKMLFKKIFSVSVLVFFSIFLVRNAWAFRDVTPNDPAFSAVTKYAERGIFNGIEGEARLDDVILKEHAALFLLKIMGVENPTVQGAVDRGIFGSLPAPGQLLDHATWIKMLSNAFEVPLGKTTEGQPWFVAPYVVAQSIMAVNDEKPFDIASRRFVVRTADTYERIFGAKNADTLMDEQELRLMRMRDLLLDPKATNDEIENLLWSNILGVDEIPMNARAESIRHLNMVMLVLLEMRKDPNPVKKLVRQKRIDYFLRNAVKALPEVSPFTEDLGKIANR